MSIKYDYFSHCVSYQLIAFWLQIHPSLLWFVILDLDPSKCSSLPDASAFGLVVIRLERQGLMTALPDFGLLLSPTTGAFWSAVCSTQKQTPSSRFQPYPGRWLLHEVCWHPRQCFLFTNTSANLCHPGRQKMSSQI